MFRFLIALCCGLTFLISSPAHVAPITQQKQCDPRGIMEGLLSNLFPNLFIREVGHTTLQVNGIDITLHVCSTSLEDYTAMRMLQRIAQVLPRMSELSGLPYDGPRDRWILVVSERELPPNVDGLFRSADSIIYLTPSSSDWTVIHETAHYWANDRNFSWKEPWMAEGYAEYLTERMMAELQSGERIRTPGSACNALSLIRWTYEHGERFRRCAYESGGAVFRDLAQQAGDDHFRAAVGYLANRDTVNSFALLDKLERLSGKDLSPIMRERVFPAEANDLLDFRRKNWDTYDQANALALQFDVALPGLIEQTLLNWKFDSAWPWLEALAQFFQAHSAYAARCAELRLDCGRISGLPTFDALIGATYQTNTARTRLDQYTPLHDAATSLDLEVPMPIRTAVATSRPESETIIAMALETIERGKTLEQTCQSLSVSCVPAWRELWNQGNLPEATATISSTARVIEYARAVDMMCGPDMIETCHSLWVPQLGRGELITATQTLNQIEALLRDASASEKACGAAEQACHQLWRDIFMHKGMAAAREQLGDLATLQASTQATEELCTSVRDTCRRIWQATLQATGIESSAETLTDLNDLMRRAGTIERTCVAQGYDCGQAWRGHFQRSASIEETQALLARLNDILPTLQQAHTQVTQPPSGAVEKMNIPFAQPRTQFAAVQQALDQSDIDQAQALAQQILDEHRRALWIRNMVIVALLASLLLLTFSFWWVKLRPRRAQHLSATSGTAARQASADELLASLLASPPAQKKGRRP